MSSDDQKPEDSLSHNTPKEDPNELWANALKEQASAEAQKSADSSTTELGREKPGNSTGKTSEKTPAYEQLKEEDKRTASNPMNNTGDLSLIMDIPIQVTVELGNTKIEIRNLLNLSHGSIIELDGIAGDPMDVLVNGCLIAQGEIVVVNEHFGIRLTDIITPMERIRRLSRML